jgi:hypothetical protein
MQFGIEIWLFQMEFSNMSYTMGWFVWEFR